MRLSSLHNTKSIKKQTGVSLIEVLVAVVILSFGLLGMAALQARTVTLNQSAYFRSQATNLAYDMTDRMRANRTAAINGNYNHPMGGNIPVGNSLSDTDLANWLNVTALTLPNGEASINVNNQTATVTIRWSDERDQVNVQNRETFTFRTEL